MKQIQYMLLFLLLFSTAFKTGKPAWMLYLKNGNPVKYEKMVRKIQHADIILFGEYHDNPISHWLQLELSRDLLQEKKDALILGAEMFESDNQLLLNEYLQGLISQNRFEAEARLWPNYQTDYFPLVELARNNQLPFVATNIPRRYAAIVSSKGFEGLTELPEQSRQYFPPLPIRYNPELKAYSNMLQMEGMKGHNNENFAKAQAIKDATMAHFIADNWSRGKLFLHFNGSYHSNNYESIYWYLKQQNQELNIATITTVSQQDISQLKKENEGLADYIICVDNDMTPTH